MRCGIRGESPSLAHNSCRLPCNKSYRDRTCHLSVRSAIASLRRCSASCLSHHFRRDSLQVASIAAKEVEMYLVVSLLVAGERPPITDHERVIALRRRTHPCLLRVFEVLPQAHRSHGSPRSQRIRLSGRRFRAALSFAGRNSRFHASRRIQVSIRCLWVMRHSLE